MKFKYEKPQNGYPEWNNNPQIVSLNMNKPHNDFVNYETKLQAMEGIKENSSRYISLNGKWKFNFCKDIKNSWNPTNLSEFFALFRLKNIIIL